MKFFFLHRLAGMKKVLCLWLILPFFFLAPSGARAEESPRILPVIMYHTILNSRTGVYIVSEAQLESDLKALKARGYEFVFPSEVVDYVNGEGSLPDKPVMLTFDDGHYNNLYYGLPLLMKYQAKANINIIGRFSEYTTSSGDVDNPNYSHLTWEEIAMLWDSGCVEIGNHTYDMHNYKPRYGIAPKAGESEEAYRAALSADIKRLQDKIYEAAGRYPTTFAYPFGRYNDTARDVLTSLGFTLMMTCNEGVNVIRRGDTERLAFIRRYNRSGRYATSEFLDRIARDEKKARENL